MCHVCSESKGGSSCRMMAMKDGQSLAFACAPLLKEFWATFPPLSPRPEVGSGGIGRKAGGVAQKTLQGTVLLPGLVPIRLNASLRLGARPGWGLLRLRLFFWAASQILHRSAGEGTGCTVCTGCWPMPRPLRPPPPAVSHSFSLTAQARSEAHKDLAGHAESHALS